MALLFHLSHLIGHFLPKNILGSAWKYIIYVYPDCDQQYTIDAWANVALSSNHLETCSCKVRKSPHLESKQEFWHEYLLIEVEVHNMAHIGILVIT